MWTYTSFIPRYAIIEIFIIFSLFLSLCRSFPSSLPFLTLLPLFPSSLSLLSSVSLSSFPFLLSFFCLQVRALSSARALELTNSKPFFSLLLSFSPSCFFKTLFFLRPGHSYRELTNSLPQSSEPRLFGLECRRLSCSNSTQNPCISSPPKETSFDPGIGAAAGVLQSALDAWPQAMSKLQRPCDTPGDAGALMKLLKEADEVALDAFHEHLSRALYNAEAGCIRSGTERIHGWENPIRSQRYSYIFSRGS